jgi:hypothetical protein
MKKVLLPYEVSRGIPPSHVYTEGSYSGHLNDLPTMGQPVQPPIRCPRASGFVRSVTISIGAAYSFVEPFADANAHRAP